MFGWYAGKFYRYIDSERLTDIYFSKQRNRYTIPSYELSSVSGDTLIFYYSTEYGAKGEFRFQWDEAAQWFSVAGNDKLTDIMSRNEDFIKKIVLGDSISYGTTDVDGGFAKEWNINGEDITLAIK